MSKSQFHLRRVTQSDYRGGSTRLKSGSDSVVLDVELAPLKLSNKETDLMKKKLSEEVEKVVSVLLSDDARDSFYKGDFLKGLYQSLGL